MHNAPGTFATKSDGLAFLSITEADIQRGAWIDLRAGKISLKTYANEWLERRPDLAIPTSELYRYLLDNHIRPELGAVSLARLAPSKVRGWHSKLSRTSKHRGEGVPLSLDHYANRGHGRPLARLTVQGRRWRHRTRGRASGRLARRSSRPHRRDARAASACRSARDMVPAPSRRVARAPSSRRRHFAREPDHRRKPNVHAQGPFRREGLEERRGAANPRHSSERPRPDPGSSRTTHVSEPGRVRVHGQDGRATHRGVLHKAWEKARIAVRRTDLHLHDLRHSGLALAAATGATTAELMHRAGHASANAALRYQHATQDRDRVLAEALAELSARADVVLIERARTNGSRPNRAQAPSQS